MIRLLKCTKDAYLTSKLISNTNTNYSRSYNSNTGQAGTIDLYKLYNETGFVSGNANVIELTRGLVYFDITPVTALYASGAINLNNSKFYLSLKDVYGGQITPTNFTVQVYPLAKAFSEGSGHDVQGYQDYDAVNWYTSSINGSTIALWTSGGCDYGIPYGGAGADYWTSGSLNGVTTSSFGVSQSFTTGDENLYVDVTSIISASVANIIPFYGFRVAFSREEENDSVTRFVKRFSTRHSSKFNQHPKLVFQSNNSIFDNQLNPQFNKTQSFFTYNFYLDNLENFSSASVNITGSNCLKVELISSKSIVYWTSSYSTSHSQSINHLTTSWQVFSQTFSGSQYYNGSQYVTGVYSASINLDYYTASVSNYLTSSTNLEVQFIWKSNDGSVVFSKGPTLIYKKSNSTNQNSAQLNNMICNITNLRQEYEETARERFRVVLFDYDTFYNPYKLPTQSKSSIVTEMHWRLINSYTKDVIIDYDFANLGSKLSTDGEGLYFDFWMEDLEINQNYEFEFCVVNNNKKLYFTNQGFKFKIS